MSQSLQRKLDSRFRAVCTAAAVMAINNVHYRFIHAGCGMCIDNHERVLTRHGVKPEPIRTATRIGAVIKAVANA